MITQEQLEQIAAAIVTDGDEFEFQDIIREKFPEFTFTFAIDEDIMGIDPVIETDRYNIYLLDTSDECFTMTEDLGAATGVIIAELMEE